MRVSTIFSLALLSVTSATPLFSKAKAKPAAFFLAGDSTTAIGGGWGNGFLSTLVNGSIGTNFGHNGATTVSFVAGGDWALVLDAVKKNKSKYEPYVTIQFGHNDQKADKNITVPQFEANLKALAKQVTAAGGTPILVTSLSRRNYHSSGQIVPNLAPQVEATLRVAQATKAAFIDLNKASTSYLNAIGSVNAYKYNLVENDRTHLNAAGGLIFGNLVARLLEGSMVGQAVDPYLQFDKKIVTAIEAGVFILP